MADTAYQAARSPAGTEVLPHEHDGRNGSGRQALLGLLAGVSVIVLRPVIAALIRNKREGTGHVPREGPVIFAPNHLSYADWATDMYFIQKNVRYPTCMIKSGAFTVPLLGRILRKLGQLPVHRDAADAALVLAEAGKRLAHDAAVVICPEGTATRDPGLWPMVARTGVARLALATAAPVIPVAHWGTDDILRYGGTRPKLFPRKTVRTIAGPPVDLSEWAGQARSVQALNAATEKIMDDITALVAQLRGETPPPSATPERTRYPGRDSARHPSGKRAWPDNPGCDFPGPLGHNEPS